MWFISTYLDNKNWYGVIFELMNRNLTQVIKDILTQQQIKSFSIQLLRSISYLHSNGIIHRDIKPDNILIKDDVLKLADYGVSRPMSHITGKYDHKIITLWYRPIEILLGTDSYDFSVDIWSCGIGEMILKTPLFTGDSEIDTIYRILRVFGKEKVEEAYSHLPKWKCHFPSLRQQNLKTNDNLAIDLLSEMLNVDSEKRIVAKNALSHNWFKKLR